MDPKSQERFDTLRRTDPANWSDADREFMRARRGYLPDDEVTALGLDEVPTPIVSSEPVEVPVREPSVEGPRTKKAKQ